MEMAHYKSCAIPLRPLPPHLVATLFPARFFASPRLCAFALNPRFPPKTAPLDRPKIPSAWHALGPAEYATDGAGIPPPPASIPKGLRHLAQGCEARATLGNRAQSPSNLNGVVPVRPSCPFARPSIPRSAAL